MKIKEWGGVRIAVMPPQIDTVVAGSLDRELRERVEKGQVYWLCDFSQSEYIASAGLRVLLSLLKGVTKAGGNLVLCGVNPGIAEIIDMTGLTELFTIKESEEEALLWMTAEAPRLQPGKILEDRVEPEEVYNPAAKGSQQLDVKA